MAKALTAKMDQEVEMRDTLGLIVVYCESRGERAMSCVIRASSARMGKGSCEVDTMN